MRKFLIALISTILGLVLMGLGGNFILNSDVRTAEKLVAQVCNGNPKVSLFYQDRANLAAQANNLDSKWLRLSDAANSLAGFERLSKERSSWIYAPGIDGAALYYQKGLMYAQFVAECSLLTKD